MITVKTFPNMFVAIIKPTLRNANFGPNIFVKIKDIMVNKIKMINENKILLSLSIFACLNGSSILLSSFFGSLWTLFNITDISNKCPKLTEDKNDFQFELSNNQQFLKNFMNKKTPYKGLVIFHGVGVGKTCSAINISSSYRDIYMTNREKIICLVPKNIRGGWENTIYDPKKGKEQCSGDNFEDIINSSDKKNILKKDVRNMIKNYYEFHGYLKFANSVRKIINKEIGNQILSEEEKIKKEQSIIKKHFSNRILIIDEIHNLREENDDTSKTDTTKKLKKGKRVSWENERGVLKVGTIISSEKDDQGNYYYYLRDQENDDFVRVSSENINKLNVVTKNKPNDQQLKLFSI